MMIAETLEKQGELIRLQSRIIDRLAIALLQRGTIEKEELDMVKQAARMQEEIKERG